MALANISPYRKSRLVLDAGLLRPGRLVTYITDPEPIPFQAFPDNQTHTIRVGDRLDNLAVAFYGDPRLGWVIAEFQPYPLESSIFLPVGRVLHIPSFDKVQRFILGTAG